MRISLFIVILAVLVIAGCANRASNEYHYPNKRDLDRIDRELGGLIDAGDINLLAENMRRAYRMPNDLKGEPLYLELEEWDRAYEFFSREFYNDLVGRDAEAARNLYNFDDYCKLKIGTTCAESAREMVAANNRIDNQRMQDELWKKVEDIRKGIASVESVDEARALHVPSNGGKLLFNPSVGGGDGKYYELTTFITSKRGGAYLSWWPDVSWDMHPVGCVIINPVLHGDIYFNQAVRVIGKYVGNREVRISSGIFAMVPVFSDAHVFPR
ncbi:hypothetical protein RSO68_03460 [Halomonas saccharevitans]|uniref:Uncharacterized protein n=1 Tax=Halomonas saccharevitans TaxID=416872 RepID=A0ABU3NBF0_9GAMM|nr:hypothetical protein [Halomonas saccharevitans]MDT8878523.1 hypothetical protein [Halomonas saccharevitans]